MTLGIPRSRIVRLEPYSPVWATEYMLERNRIILAVGDRLQGIEHIGSTAVPGICAKPVIDIMIGIESLEQADLLAPAMAGIGYDYPGDIGIPDERILGRGPELRTHLVHVVVTGGRAWRNYMVFRDALVGDSALAREYHELKIELARRFPEDRASYTEAKSVFIEKVLNAVPPPPSGPARGP